MGAAYLSSPAGAAGRSIRFVRRTENRIPYSWVKVVNDRATLLSENRTCIRSAFPIARISYGLDTGRKSTRMAPPADRMVDVGDSR